MSDIEFVNMVFLALFGVYILTTAFLMATTFTIYQLANHYNRPFILTPNMKLENETKIKFSSRLRSYGETMENVTMLFALIPPTAMLLLIASASIWAVFN